MLEIVLVEREVLVFNGEVLVQVLVLILAGARWTVFLGLFGLLTGLVVRVLVKAFGSVIVFVEVGELFFRGLLVPGVLESDFARVYRLENVVLMHGTCKGEAVSRCRTSTGTMQGTVQMTVAANADSLTSSSC